jgi:hypothetical protein
MEDPVIQNDRRYKAPIGIIQTGIIESHTEKKNDDGGHDIEDQHDQDGVNDGNRIIEQPYHDAGHGKSKQANDESQSLSPFLICHSAE